MYVVMLSKNPNFGPKTSCFVPKWLFLMVQKFSKVFRLIGLIECVILRYHTPLYLNVFGQAHQVSKSVPPLPVPPFGVDKSGGTRRASPEGRASLVLGVTCVHYGRKRRKTAMLRLYKGPKRGQKGLKRAQEGTKIFLLSLKTIRNALKI